MKTFRERLISTTVLVVLVSGILVLMVRPMPDLDAPPASPITEAATVACAGPESGAGDALVTAPPAPSPALSCRDRALDDVGFTTVWMASTVMTEC